MTAQNSQTPNGRRKFLRTGCIVAAAAGVTVCGGGVLAATYQPKIDLPSISYGDTSMKRVLIAYASKAGSTAEAANRMGAVLSKQGIAVDMQPVTAVSNLSPYSAVILGSAIRVGSLLPEAITFLQKNQAALSKTPFSVFILCMTLEKDTEETRKTVSAYLDPVRAIIKPASEGLFAGAMIPGKLRLFERVMMMAMKVPTGDFRKWDQIEGWAQGLAV